MARNIDAQKGFLSRLGRNEAGNVLAMTAAATFPLLGMVGGAVDMARMYAVKSRLQAACDAGALAGRRVMGNGAWSDNSNAANTSAEKAFALNFESGSFGSQNETRSFTESGGTVTGAVSAQVPMTIMRLFGRPTKTISVTCDGMMRIPNTDVMFVLDNSGSMACLISESFCSNNATNRARYDAKINGLKRAVKCFYEALAKQDIDDVTPAECGTTANPSGGLSNNVQLRFGFVNYDHMVNTGKLLPNDYFVNSATYQSREPHYLDVQAWSLGTEGSTSWGSWSSAPTNLGNSSTYSGWSDISGGGSVTVNGTSYTKQPGGKNSTTCPQLNNANGIVEYTNSGANVQTAVEQSRTNSPPTHPASSQTVTYNQDDDRTAVGYRYKWNTSSNKCRLQKSGNYNYSLTRSGTSSVPITWTPHTTIDYWTYKAVSLNVSALKNGGSNWNSSVDLPLSETNGATVKLSGSNSNTTLKVLANMSASWAGCIQERRTFLNTDGNPSDDWNSYPSSPATANDMDIDGVPSTSDDNTRWAPALDSAVWARRTGGSGTETTADVTGTTSLSRNLGFSNCGVTPSRKLTQYTGTTGADAMRDYVNTLIPNGNTYHDIGLLWGARLMSPTGIFASENATTPGGAQIQRHMIFMTDGDTANTFNNYASYGIEWWDRRQVTPAGNTSTDITNFENNLEANNNARAAALCTAIKNKGITLWVISYGSGVTGPTVTRLTACATSPAYFFQASDTTSLITQFRNIADKISQLRLTN